MKKILLSLSVIILILTACLVTISNPDKPTAVGEKIEQNLFDFNSTNLKTTYQKNNKLPLEERKSSFIKKHI